MFDVITSSTRCLKNPIVDISFPVCFFLEADGTQYGREERKEFSTVEKVVTIGMTHTKKSMMNCEEWRTFGISVLPDVLGFGCQRSFENCVYSSLSQSSGLCLCVRNLRFQTRVEALRNLRETRVFLARANPCEEHCIDLLRCATDFVRRFWVSTSEVVKVSWANKI